MENLKIVLMGTPVFAATIFKKIIEAGYPISLMVSQPDKEVGRKRILQATATKELANQYGIEVFQPLKIRKDYTRIQEINPDLIITCAYGQLLPTALLDIPRLGCINIHGSLLPKLRGGAPIHHAIIDGYQETGITIMEMIDKMDAGDMFAQAKTAITDEDTLDSLSERLMNIGSDLILDFLPKYLNQDYIRTKQAEEEVTFGYNIKREEERIDWQQPQRKVFNQIRGLNSTPGAFTMLDDVSYKIFDVRLGALTTNYEPGMIRIIDNSIEVQCLDGTIIVDSLQVAGKAKVQSRDYLRGNAKNLEQKKFQ